MSYLFPGKLVDFLLDVWHLAQIDDVRAQDGFILIDDIWLSPDSSRISPARTHCTIGCPNDDEIYDNKEPLPLQKERPLVTSFKFSVIKLNKYGLRQRRFVLLDVEHRVLRILDLKDQCKTEFRIEDVWRMELNHGVANRLKLVFHSYTKHRAYNLHFESTYDFVQFASRLQSVMTGKVLGEDDGGSSSDDQLPHERTASSFCRQAVDMIAMGAKLECDRCEIELSRDMLRARSATIVSASPSSPPMRPAGQSQSGSQHRRSKTSGAHLGLAGGSISSFSPPSDSRISSSSSRVSSRFSPRFSSSGAAPASCSTPPSRFSPLFGAASSLGGHAGSLPRSQTAFPPSRRSGGVTLSAVDADYDPFDSSSDEVDRNAADNPASFEHAIVTELGGHATRHADGSRGLMLSDFEDESLMPPPPQFDAPRSSSVPLEERRESLHKYSSSSPRLGQHKTLPFGTRLSQDVCQYNVIKLNKYKMKQKRVMVLAQDEGLIRFFDHHRKCHKEIPFADISHVEVPPDVEAPISSGLGGSVGHLSSHSHLTEFGSRVQLMFSSDQRPFEVRFQDEHDLTHFCRHLRLLSPSTTVQDFSNRRSLARLLRNINGKGGGGHGRGRRRSTSVDSRGGVRNSFSMSRRSSVAPPTRFSTFQRYVDGTEEDVPKLGGAKAEKPRLSSVEASVAHMRFSVIKLRKMGNQRRIIYLNPTSKTFIWLHVSRKQTVFSIDELKRVTLSIVDLRKLTLVFRRRSVGHPSSSRSAAPSIATAILKQTNPLNISQTTRELPTNIMSSISHLHRQSVSASAAFSSLSTKGGRTPFRTNHERRSLQPSATSYPSTSAYVAAAENNRSAANGVAVPSQDVDAVYHVLFSTKMHRTKFIQALTNVTDGRTDWLDDETAHAHADSSSTTDGSCGRSWSPTLDVIAAPLQPVANKRAKSPLSALSKTNISITSSRRERPSSPDGGRPQLKLSDVISNDAGFTAFRRFLKAEFAAENLEFWKAVQVYKKESSRCSTQDLLKRAQMLIDRYISSDAAEPVNLDYRARTMIENACVGTPLKIDFLNRPAERGSDPPLLAQPLNRSSNTYSDPTPGGKSRPLVPGGTYDDPRKCANSHFQSISHVSHLPTKADMSSARSDQKLIDAAHLDVRPLVSMFDRSQECVYQLLDIDPYRRFAKSDDFKLYYSMHWTTGEFVQ